MTTIHSMQLVIVPLQIPRYVRYRLWRLAYRTFFQAKDIWSSSKAEHREGPFMLCTTVNQELYRLRLANVILARPQTQCLNIQLMHSACCPPSSPQPRYATSCWIVSSTNLVLARNCRILHNKYIKSGEEALDRPNTASSH